MSDVKKSHLRIAVIFNVLNEQFQISLLEGMKETAKELDLELFFIQQEIAFSKTYIATKFPNPAFLDADGIILLSSVFAGSDRIKTKSDIENLFGKIPVLSIGLKIPGVPSLLIRTKDSMEHLVAHLVEQHNYNSFVFLSGLADHKDNQNREEVFRSSMDKYKKENRPVSFDIVCGNFSEVDSMNAMSHYINEHADKAADVVVCANDNMAIGTYKVLKTLPADSPWRNCHVTGFDDTPQAQLAIPQMTTVRQPLVEMGHQSVKIMNRILKKENVSEETDIESKLVLRNSCGCKLYSQNTQNIIDTLQHDYFQSEQLLRQTAVFGQEINGSDSLDVLKSTLNRNLDLLEIKTFMILSFDKNNTARVIYSKLNGVSLQSGISEEITNVHDFINDISSRTEKSQCYAVKFLLTSEGTTGCIFYDSPAFAHPYVFSLSVNIAQKIQNIKTTMERSLQAQKLEEEVEKRTKELVKANNRRLQVEAEVLKISEMERKRFSTDLHDDICQRLAGISMLCKSYSHNPQGTSSEQMSELATLISDTLSATRQYAHNSFPVDLDALGLADSVETLLVGLSKNAYLKSEYKWNLPKDTDFEKTAAVNIFRIIQESLHNVIKHAHATKVVVSAEKKGNFLVFSVSDDGNGIPKNLSGKGMGLHSMEYRANQIGARFSIKQNKPKGTTVEIKLPF